MTRKIIVCILGLVLIIALFISCDDETVVVGNGPEYLIIGDVLMRPYLEILGNIHPVNGQSCDIDSIKFADSLCKIIKNVYYVDGTNYNYSFSYRNQADSLRYGSGDIAPLHIYRDNEIVSAYIKLLKVPDDTVNIVSPDYNENFAVNDPVPLIWNKVAHADWYSVTYIYDTSDVFGSEITYHYETTTDTTFTIPQTDHITNGQYIIYITSISGPVPGSTGNIDGADMVGTIYGSATPGVRMGLRVVIGSGPSGGDVTVDAKQIENQTIIQKIMSNQNR